MVNPHYFIDKFKATFGKVQFVVEKLGSGFAFILFLKLVVEIISAFVRGFEIHKFTKKTTSLGRVIVSAVFNVFYLTAITKVFSDEIDELYGDKESLIHDKKENRFKKNKKPPKDPPPPELTERTYAIPREYIHPKGITMETGLPSYMEMKEMERKGKIYPQIPTPLIPARNPQNQRKVIIVGI